ncbi:hypothetical protein [Geofilum rubicundum]|uniref:ClpB protein n=1 Tax=Geofilum rubicundum JCM 15548 TaxID=1236989 RepID=A0A0E9M0M0_9BACT|nr:hypothetical protein [Geofilum rubicundum]GAO31044.1 ClpB protein [Geofilum rubicundum JCM 15548]
MDFLNLNESVKTAIRIAQGISREYGNGCYTPAHLLKALLHKEIGMHGFIRNLDKDLEYLEEWAEVRMDEVPKAGVSAEIVASPEIAVVFEESDNVRLKLGLLEVNPICVLAALSKPGIGFEASHLKSFPIRENEIHELYFSARETRQSVASQGMEDGMMGSGAHDFLAQILHG